MNKHIPDEVSRVLVVEGNEDRYFFSKWLEHLGKHGECHFAVCDGKDNIAIELVNILIDDNFINIDQIGIICDNDYSESRHGKQAFEVVLEEIVRANQEVKESGPLRELPIPEQPRQPIGNRPSISVLLLPADEEDGMLESLVLKAIGQNDIMDCVDEYFCCLNKAGLELKKARESRSRLSVYISGKTLAEEFATNDDSRRWFLTQAVAMKWWEDAAMWDHPTFDDARAFLNQLLAE